jgi:hypothetical protein
MFNSSCQQVNIVFAKKDICILADVIIVNPMQADLLPQSCATQIFVASNVAQAKERSYCDRHPTNQFFSLTIEVFECLHKQA